MSRFWLTRQFLVLAPALIVIGTVVGRPIAATASAAVVLVAAGIAVDAAAFARVSTALLVTVFVALLVTVAALVLDFSTSRTLAALVSCFLIFGLFAFARFGGAWCAAEDRLWNALFRGLRGRATPARRGETNGQRDQSAD